MKNIKLILFFVLIAMYAAGIWIGSMEQIRTKNQDEMYEYIERSVAEYKVTSLESIKSVGIDNLKLFAIVIISGFFRLGIAIMAAMMLLKGYMSGFAITSMLRFYGLGGFFFCGASIGSAILLIPSLALFGGASFENTLYNRNNKKLFLKSCLIFSAFMLVILCIDTAARGVFSTLFIKLGSTLTKPA